MTIQEVIGDYNRFLDKVFESLKKTSFGMDEFVELDHIAYRTENNERYEEIKKELMSFSSSQDEKMFRGRNIFVCRLKEPLVYGGFEISGFELLAPKEENQYKEGLEHAEFVVKGTLAEFKDRHSDIDFILDAYDMDINPELIVKFDNCSAKFHEQSLLDLRGI